MTLTLSPDEAAAELGVSAATVRQWVREGRLVKLPMRKCRVLRTSIEAMVNGYGQGEAWRLPAVVGGEGA